jgi:hypothetical protein
MLELPKNPYHFVFDCFSPLHKCGGHSRLSWINKRRMTAAIENALRVLNPDGILLIVANQLKL